MNDRRILKAMAAAAGFAEDSYGEVFIILDKVDKIGLEGVEKELLESGYPQAAVEAYVAFFRKAGQGLGCAEFCGEALADTLEAGVVQNLDTILDCVRATAAGSFELVFDPTLVRGMGYYTGTIFEVELPEFGSSVAGGGRYDEMVGRFCGQKVPACGFSIGFERIITILKDRGFTPPQEGSRVAFLADKALSGQQLVELFRQAAELRAQGVQVMVTTRKKNAKNQKEVLKAEGYTDFREFFA